MDESGLLIALGVVFLAGLALDAFGRLIHVPRVTLLMLLGAFLGPPLLDVLPAALSDNKGIYSHVALTMVAFLLGGVMKPETVRQHGTEILIFSLCVVAASVAFVTAGLVLVGVELPLALLLAGIATATAPAATLDVVKQSGRTDRFATNIMSIVAIDDAWGVLLFSAMMVLAGIFLGQDASDGLLHGLWEVFGAIGLGCAIGFPAAYLTGRLKPGEPTLIEAVGLVFLCCGGALALDVSFLLTGMICGAVIVNFARHHNQPFHEIERIEWPFLLLFFVMAGASFETSMFTQIGLIALLYIALRAVARLAGGAAGSLCCGLTIKEGMFTGMALMPQAGIAIGMALVAAEAFPDYAATLTAIVIATTIIFELVGPLCTQIALKLVPESEPLRN